MSQLITLGTKTSTGGEVITASSDMTICGVKVVKLGDIATCTCGSKSCRGQGPIYKAGTRKIEVNGSELAKEGDPVDTGCSSCVLLAPNHNVNIGGSSDGIINIGGNGNGITIGGSGVINIMGAGLNTQNTAARTTQTAKTTVGITSASSAPGTMPGVGYQSPTHKTRNADIESLVADNLTNFRQVTNTVKSEFITCDPKEFFYSKILVHEGGFVDNPNDRGGATNKGVTIGTWKDYAEKIFNITPSVDSLKAMTDEQAYKIFVEGYWKKSLANKIKNCPIAFQFVDFYYNAPQGSAVVLQRTINELGGNVVEDWYMGSSSLNAINDLIDAGKEKEIYLTFRKLRIAYYNHRADTVAGQSVFRNGWVARAESFKDY